MFEKKYCRKIHLPTCALTIFAQVLMGVRLGTAGTVFATPLAACAVVLVKMLYVESTLGDDAQATPAEDSKDASD